VDDDLNLLTALATTRAIRRYRSEPIPEGDLQRILWYASRAPSGSNRQPFRFLVISHERTDVRIMLAEAFRDAWQQKRTADGYRPSRFADSMQEFVDDFEHTPGIILVCLERYRAPSVYEGASVYPAVQNLLLAARGLGYGGALTMWHLSVEAELRQALEIPEEVALSACVTLGRPKGKHGPLRRRPLEELVYVDRWGAAPSGYFESVSESVSE
jgi:nitroreductase